MSDEHRHARLIREFHHLQNGFYAGGDQAPVAKLLSDGVVWRVPGRSAIAGEHRGRDEVLKHFAKRRQLAPARFHIDLRGVLADDQRAVIMARGTVGLGDGALSWRTVAVFGVTEGVIADCLVLPYDQSAFDGIWHQATELDATQEPSSTA